jgi:ubiquinone/menaquinone biosynthesis C-methylase UbiE
MSASGSRAFDDGGVSPETAAGVYDRIGRFQDTQSPFERPALDRLIACCRFDIATSVFELGCGTGTLAHRLLSDHLPPQSTYLGVDVSSQMVKLASRRIATFADRARVVHTDGRLPLPARDRSADRFIAAYVFDLLSHDYATQLIDEAHRLLIPGGLACLASLTTGQSTLARLISRSWHGIWRVAPRLVLCNNSPTARDPLDHPRDQSFAHTGTTITTTAMATCAYDQIDQARAELNEVSK